MLRTDPLNEADKTKVSNPLPKTLPLGSICVQMVKCGKPNCHCAGGKLHGPYHYLFFRRNGRLTKRYIRREELDDVASQLESHRQAVIETKNSNYSFHRLNQSANDIEKLLAELRRLSFESRELRPTGHVDAMPVE